MPGNEIFSIYGHSLKALTQPFVLWSRNLSPRSNRFYLLFHYRKDNSGERYKNVAIHVGDMPAVPGALVTNPECAIFQVVLITGKFAILFYRYR
jgi:hypothetical protein